MLLGKRLHLSFSAAPLRQLDGRRVGLYIAGSESGGAPYFSLSQGRVLVIGASHALAQILYIATQSRTGRSESHQRGDRRHARTVPLARYYDIPHGPEIGSSRELPRAVRSKDGYYGGYREKS